MAVPRPRLQPIAPEAFKLKPWKNGGGMSVTIAEERLPGAAADSWDGVAWQLGYTTIERPGPFSDLTGFERLQTVVSGRGLVLESAGGEIDLRAPFTVARYDGGLPIVSRLEDGPVQVVNLIARRELADIALAVLGPGGTADGPGMYLAFAFEGPALLDANGQDVCLAAGHAVSINGCARLACRAGHVVQATIILQASNAGTASEKS